MTTACTDCPLAGQTCPGTGPETASLVVVGEAPGATELRRGVPFVGPSGQLLDATLAEFGWRRQNTYTTNAFLCGMKDPAQADMERCYPRLRQEIHTRQPTVVVALGATAMRALTGYRSGITEVQGACTWVPDLDTFVIPTFHPASVLRGNESHFDYIYDTLGRAVKFCDGRLETPPAVLDIPWYFVRNVAETRQLFNSWLARVRTGQHLVIGCDTESVAPGGRPMPLSDTWNLVQFDDGDKAYAVLVSALDTRNRQLFKALLRHDRVTWIWHNLSYDTQVLRHNLGAEPKHNVDTMVLGMGLSEIPGTVGLEALARAYCNAPFYKKELLDSGFSFARGPVTEEQWRAFALYGARDAHYTRRLGQLLPGLVQAEGTAELCQDLLLPAQRALSQLSYHGIAIDQEHADTVRRRLEPEIAKAERQLQDLAARSGFPVDTQLTKNQQRWVTCDHAGSRCSTCRGRGQYKARDDTLNVRSPKQLCHLAFDMLGYKPVDGRRSVDRDFVNAYADTELGSLLYEIRSKDKALRTYVYGVLDDVYADGRVHPDFKLEAAETGRLAIKHPPMQTLPKHGERSQEFSALVRSLFVPSFCDGLIVEADYGKLELFVGAWLSGDANLLEALTSADFHTEVASGVFNVHRDQVTKRQRYLTKFISYGVSYGRSAAALAKGELHEATGGNVSEAQRYVDSFWSRFPDFKALMDQSQQSALKDGEVVNPFGRKRRWRLITPDNKHRVLNQAVNAPIQGGASDLCLSALTRLAFSLPERGYGAVLSTVHDALVCEVHKDCLTEAVDHIVSEMCSPPVGAHIPWAVDVDVGPSLGQTESYRQSATLDNLAGQ